MRVYTISQICAVNITTRMNFVLFQEALKLMTLLLLLLMLLLTKLLKLQRKDDWK